MPRKPAPTLIAGPYATPGCKVGAEFPDLLHGDRPIRGLTDAPISWPFSYAPKGNRQLHVTGDLERAIRTESVMAVAHWWGVSRWWVERARRALGVARMTPGTTALWRELATVRLGRPRKGAHGHGPPKLSDAQVRDLRRRAAKGETNAALGRRFRVSRQYVGQLVAGRRRAEATKASP